MIRGLNHESFDRLNLAGAQILSKLLGLDGLRFVRSGVNRLHPVCSVDPVNLIGHPLALYHRPNLAGRKISWNMHGTSV